MTNSDSIKPDSNGYFITGSDTDVGKTYIACQVVAQLRAAGLAIETRKPAESGCLPGPGGEPLTHDAAALQQVNGERESIERIARYRFRAALAPHRAARLEGKRVLMQQLVEACARDNPGHCLVVEGAGGFYSPLAEDGLNADLAQALQLAVIIVVNDRIGAVNQALMTLQAVASRHLPVAAIVLNQVKPVIDKDMNNAADLQVYCQLPVFSCAHGAQLGQVFETGHG
ncbi:MAG: dethiobiotin synthase [Gammaproteobacteria bacterium]|nr:dethiobiotin synthase [Gammaproteobacteria bacterium]